MTYLKNNMTSWLVLILVCFMILTGCGTVRQGTVCPQIPELSARVPLGESFRNPMRDFLRGKLPEPTRSEQPSTPATNTLIP